MVQEATRERLSRERILAAALDLVETDGLEALSMRRLAEALDVWPMSLYRYFQDKEQLLAALADAAAAEIDPPPADGPWRDRITAVLAQAKRVFERHPRGLRPGDDGTGGARVREDAMAILAEAGFGPAESERAWAALLAYTAGVASFEASAAEFEYGLARLLDGLEASR